MVRALAAAAVLSSLAGCAAPATAPAEARSGDAIAIVRPAIVKLRLRDVDLTVESGSRGPLFAVASRDGSFAERDLGPDDFAARYPELYRFYRSAVARTPEGPYLDARLDMPLGTDRAGGRPSR